MTRRRRTVVVVVDVVDLGPAVDAYDVDDSLVVGRSHVQREDAAGVLTRRPRGRRGARRDVRHVERTGERLNRPLSRRNRDAEQGKHAVRHRRTYCNTHVRPPN